MGSSAFVWNSRGCLVSGDPRLGTRRFASGRLPELLPSPPGHRGRLHGVEVIGSRTRSVLLERESEMASLSALVDRARAGDGQAVVIAGPPGIGKTALLEAATQL